MKALVEMVRTKQKIKALIEMVSQQKMKALIEMVRTKQKMKALMEMVS